MPREYLKIEDAKVGMEVEIDSGFTCIEPGRVLLHGNEHGLYFNCNQGCHYLTGQCDDGIRCYGIYP